MSDAAKPKPAKIKSAQDFIAAQSRRTEAVAESAQPAAQTDAARFADIKSNPFYKVMLDDARSPEEKLKAVTEALTFADDREQARETLAAFNSFKEFLQFERKRMAQEIIALTDTEAFAELKSVFEDINTALLTFEDQIGPLTDIVDAVYTLRMNGVTFDVFAELLREREEQQKREAEKAELKGKLGELEKLIHGLRLESKRLEEDKSFFGLGGTKKSAREMIAVNEGKIEEQTGAMQSLVDRIRALDEASSSASEFAEFAEEKEKLRELLDISSEDHQARQVALVESAQAFIDTTETRVSSVLSHFNGMNGQIDNLDEANFTMRGMYAILNDAIKGAEGANETRREEIKAAIEKSDSDLERLNQERLERDLNGHISSLGRSSVDTTSVLAELTASGHRIHSMREANEQQVAKTRALHTSGVAGVADQLSTVLQAVSAAALGESSEAAKISLERMNRTTSDLSQREVIRVALGTKELNEDLSKALSDLSEYGETIRAATSITREGLTETRELLDQIERQTADTQAAVKESLDVAADVAGGKGGVTRDRGTGEGDAAEAPESPFGLGKS
ncbi:MAG: hypothetical protein QNJ13_07900 [Paracoccaceae bacterium]|nr:hypothetical protein [Paracoccaceae bacterium]